MSSQPIQFWTTKPTISTAPPSKMVITKTINSSTFKKKQGARPSCKKYLLMNKRTTSKQGTPANSTIQEAASFKKTTRHLEESATTLCTIKLKSNHRWSLRTFRARNRKSKPLKSLLCSSICINSSRFNTTGKLLCLSSTTNKWTVLSPTWAKLLPSNRSQASCTKLAIWIQSPAKTRLSHWCH